MVAIFALNAVKEPNMRRPDESDVSQYLASPKELQRRGSVADLQGKLAEIKDAMAFVVDAEQKAEQCDDLNAVKVYRHGGRQEFTLKEAFKLVSQGLEQIQTDLMKDLGEE